MSRTAWTKGSPFGTLPSCFLLILSRFPTHRTFLCTGTKFTIAEKMKLRKASKDNQKSGTQFHSIQVEYGNRAGGNTKWYHSWRVKIPPKWGLRFDTKTARMILDSILRNYHFEKRAFRGCWRVRKVQISQRRDVEERPVANQATKIGMSQTIFWGWFFERYLFSRFCWKTISTPPL